MRHLLNRKLLFVHRKFAGKVTEIFFMPKKSTHSPSKLKQNSISLEGKYLPVAWGGGVRLRGLYPRHQCSVARPEFQPNVTIYGSVAIVRTSLLVRIVYAQSISCAYPLSQAHHVIQSGLPDK